MVFLRQEVLIQGPSSNGTMDAVGVLCGLRWLRAGLSACLLTSLAGAQEPLGPARIRTFQVVPGTARPGDTLEFRWSVTGTYRVRLEPWDQEFPSEGRATYVLTERTVFWLHASNALGGQSLPLVVDILPVTVAAPPPVAQPAPRPVVQPAIPPPYRPEPGRAHPGGVWIQFAALAEQARVSALLRDLEGITGGRLAVFEIQDPELPGGTLQRIRMGPFRTVGEARERLRQLQPRLKRLRIHPIVAID